MKTKRLPLKEYGCYRIRKIGVTFYTKNGFSVFVPKQIIKRIGVWI